MYVIYEFLTQSLQYVHPSHKVAYHTLGHYSFILRPEYPYHLSDKPFPSAVPTYRVFSEALSICSERPSTDSALPSALHTQTCSRTRICLTDCIPRGLHSFSPDKPPFQSASTIFFPCYLLNTSVLLLCPHDLTSQLKNQSKMQGNLCGAPTSSQEPQQTQMQSQPRTL